MSPKARQRWITQNSRAVLKDRKGWLATSQPLTCFTPITSLIPTFTEPVLSYAKVKYRKSVTRNVAPSLSGAREKRALRCRRPSRQLFKRRTGGRSLFFGQTHPRQAVSQPAGTRATRAASVCD
ncbi:hypothetical protein EVAR_36245_1 [Eumeta japonica]|uniref:Uncharacterized protein n=1 Tax=Eumeta variegata TaxID=151549 RepID=A0A4C1WXX4_EUMVA|nr:hypothetical protein EVAR_36245_1 [Eumeta japonica]